MNNCNHPECKKKGQFGMYVLNEDGTKTWHNFCEIHDRFADRQNQIVRAKFPVHALFNPQN